MDNAGIEGAEAVFPVVGDTAQADGSSGKRLGDEPAGSASSAYAGNNGAGSFEAGEEADSSRLRVALVYEGKKEYVQVSWDRARKVFAEMLLLGCGPLEAFDKIEELLSHLARRK